MAGTIAALRRTSGLVSCAEFALLPVWIEDKGDRVVDARVERGGPAVALPAVDDGDIVVGWASKQSAWVCMVCGMVCVC